MKTINKIAMYLAKVVEIIYWLATGLMAFASIMIIGFFDQANYILKYAKGSAIRDGMAVYKLDIPVLKSNGSLNLPTFLILMVGAIVMCVISALIFRYLYKVLKELRGYEGYSVENSPFKPNIANMLRKIGYMSISLPVVSLVVNILAYLFIPANQTFEIEISLTGFILGIFALCLTQIFTYGSEMEREMEGLV